MAHEVDLSLRPGHCALEGTIARKGQPDLTWRVRSATLADALLIDRKARPEDVAECRASSGWSVREAICYGIANRTETLTAEVGPYGPVAAFGTAASQLPTVGTVWMLATTDLPACARALLAISPPVLARFWKLRPILTNAVDDRNTVHIRWLKRIGAQFIQHHPNYGVERRPFSQFILCATHSPSPRSPQASPPLPPE